MFWRFVASAFAVFMAIVGLFMLDCTHDFLGALPDDPFLLCIEADVSWPGGSHPLSIGLLAVAFGTLVVAWVPRWLDRRREVEALDEASEALATNVQRLPEQAVSNVPEFAFGKGADDESDTSREDPEVEEKFIDLDSHAAQDQESADESGSDLDQSYLSAQSLTRRIDLMKDLLVTQGIAPALLTKRWIGMLREANELHMRGVLSKEVFSEINTELLDLFWEPEPSEPVNAE